MQGYYRVDLLGNAAHIHNAQPFLVILCLIFRGTVRFRKVQCAIVHIIGKGTNTFGDFFFFTVFLGQIVNGRLGAEMRVQCPYCVSEQLFKGGVFFGGNRICRSVGTVYHLHIAENVIGISRKICIAVEPVSLYLNTVAFYPVGQLVSRNFINVSFLSDFLKEKNIRDGVRSRGPESVIGQAYCPYKIGASVHFKTRRFVEFIHSAA